MNFLHFIKVFPLRLNQSPKEIVPTSLRIFSRSSSNGSPKKSRFYFPDKGKSSSNGMEIWRLIMLVRDRYSARALTAEEKMFFYRDVKMSLEKVLNHMVRISMPVTSHVQLAQIASKVGDISISLQVFKAFEAVGVEGLKMVMENVNKEDDELVVVNGMILPKTHVHPLFIKSPIGIEAFEDTLVIICAGQPQPEELEPYVKFAAGQPLLLIFQSLSPTTLYFLIKQRFQSKFPLAAIELNKYVQCPLTLQDLKVLTGCQIINFGSKVESPNSSLYGRVGNVFVSHKHVLFLKIKEDEGGKANIIEEMESSLLPGLPGTDTISLERLKILKNTKVALLMIGGDNEMRRTQRMGSAVDALQLAQEAAESGLLPGAGRILVEILKILGNQGRDDSSYASRAGTAIVTDAVYLLYQQSIYHPSGKHFTIDQQISRVMNLPLFYSYDPDLGQYINLFELGLIDSSKEIMVSLYYALERSNLYEHIMAVIREDKKRFPLFEEDVDPP